jgi:hypothetical protein
LKNSEFVDGSRMGVIGHSMGGGTAETIARMHPDNMAVIIQAGPAVNMSTVLGMHNYLEIWTYYEELFITEMESRADYMARGKAMIEYNLDLIGETPRNDYVDENYGNFSEGTAQRYALCSCTHPGGTWNRKSIQESVAWMQQALMGELYSESLMLEAGQQYYQIKETLTLIALIAALISILPLASMLMDTKYFSELITPMSEKIPNPGGKWWKAATINTLIGGISFIFLPMIGMIGFGALTIVLPLFRLLTGNGSLLWLLVNAGICIILFNAWFKRNKEPLGLTLEDLGAFPRKKNDDQSRYLLKTFLLTVIVFGYLYILVTIIQSYFMVELRAMWPILKMFTPYRFGLFLLYLIPMYPFFKVNGGLFMFGQARMKPMKSPALTQLVWWLKYIFAMEAGLFLVFLIQYIPLFVFKTGPGLGFGMLQLLFGLFGIFSFQILPQFAIVFFITTYLFRKTGKIYVGAYIATMLATWIMAISGQLV